MAVFFDSLKLRWQYETEGFILSSGYYLPDFWLPDQRLWLEVKGTEPEGAELDRWSEFATAADWNWEIFAEEGFDFIASNPLPDEWRGRALLAFGDIPNPRQHRAGTSESMLTFGDSHFEWTRCGSCGTFGAEWAGLADKLGCDCHYNGEDPNGGDDELILAAYAKARSARFEFDQRERWGDDDSQEPF